MERAMVVLPLSKKRFIKAFTGQASIARHSFRHINSKLDNDKKCNYNNYKFSPIKLKGVKYMENHSRSREAKLVPIGNSKGVRIPKALLQKYGLKNSLIIEETEKGLLLRNKEDSRLSWEDTYKAMASEKENWDDFDTTLLDGLEDEDFEY